MEAFVQHIERTTCQRLEMHPGSSAASRHSVLVFAGQERRVIEEDCTAFERVYRLNFDLRTISGGQSLRTIHRFLRQYLNVAHWNQPKDNADLQRCFQKAVRDEQLIPVVDRTSPFASWRTKSPSAPPNHAKHAIYRTTPMASEYLPRGLSKVASVAEPSLSEALSACSDTGLNGVMKVLASVLGTLASGVANEAGTGP